MITEGTTTGTGGSLGAPQARVARASRSGETRLDRTNGESTKKAAARASASSGDFLDRSLLWRRVGWVAGAMGWIFIALAMFSFSPEDPPSRGTVPLNNPPVNLCGKAGAWLAYHSFEYMGYGALVLLVLVAVWLGLIVSGRRVTQMPIRIIGSIFIAIALAGMQQLVLPSTGPVPGLAGGMIGKISADRLMQSFSSVGTFLILSLGLMIGAVVALDVWALIAAMWTGRLIFAGARHSGRLAAAAARAAGERRAQFRAAGADGRFGGQGDIRIDDVSDDEELPELADSRSSRVLRAGAGVPVARPAGMKPALMQNAEEDDASLFDPAGSGLPAADPRRRVVSVKDDSIAPDQAEEGNPGEDQEKREAAAQPQAFTPEQLRAKIAKLPVRFAAVERRSATDEDLRDVQNHANLEGYRFPGLDLLEEPEVNFSQTMENFVRDQAEALERALKEYRIDGEVVGVESGPVITLYEVRLAPGTKVAALQAVASDLARSLKAINIRIVPNTAGRDTVGVEVPNAQKEKVRLKELMTRSDIHSKMALPMFLGKDASGEPMICDLAGLPHMLIAGTTGSGKSVCMNTIIMSFLYTKKPNELKLVLVDPKMVELSQFKDIPHLMCPVVTEMGKAAAILEWAVNKMDERYELLAEAGCRDISAYNALEWEELKERLSITTPEEEAKVPRKLPYMVFVIDELADLMMTNKEVEHAIVRIAQKARAVGMHLIVATQRPQANVVTGLIKSNMPGRLCFKVASGMDSRIVLDQKGGELLLGQGDMLYLSPRSSKLTRAQGTLVDDKEIRRVVKFMKEVAQPTFERSLMQIRAGVNVDQLDASAAAAAGYNGNFNMGDRNGFQAAQEDPMFDEAVEIVIESRRGSVSMLQRRLAIGYTRAARLIEMMGEAGILGGHKGTVSRDVIMTIDEWRAIKAQAAADAAASDENDGLQRGPDGELNSHPQTGETLEALQARVNAPAESDDQDVIDEYADDEDIEETDHEHDEEDEDEDGDDADGGDRDEDPPFRVEIRRPGSGTKI